MARENTTKYALLGLLSFCPMSGYDVKKAIEGSLTYFWNESYGQIYPVMKQLADEGFTVKSVERQSGKPDRHVYAITDAGRDELRRWLQRPVAPHRERVEVLLKLFFAHQLPKSETLRHLERFREEHLALLETYRIIQNRLQHEWAGGPAAPFSLFTVRCGLHISQAYVDWCDETMAELIRMPEFSNEG